MNKRLQTFMYCLMGLFVNISIGTTQVGINSTGADPDASAMLEVTSTDKGILIPRMTTTQRTNISSPATGLLVYDNTTNSFWFRNGTAWVELIEGIHSAIQDVDGNTKIEVEKNTNEDIVRISLAGVEKFRLTKNANFQSQIILPNSGSNIFFGVNSGNSNSTGIGNICLGDLSGENLTSGSLNTFLGGGAGFSNSGGSDNVYLGQSAGGQNEQGSSNVCIGRDAGNFISGGSNNVMVGYQAGYLTSLNTSSGNVFLGRQAGYNETGNNKLFIENSNASIPLIWGDFSVNRVGINHVATTNTLEVGGTASKASAGSWLANSDARLKKNITQLSSEKMLHNLLNLKGVTYEWDDTITGNNRPKGVQYGFTAQNIQEVFPTLVTEDNSGFLQTAYGTYDAMTVEAIRALNDKIENLEDLSRNLADENKYLKNRLEKIETLLQINSTAKK